MIPDRDVWRAALLIVKRYGGDAMPEAAERAELLLEDGDVVRTIIDVVASPHKAAAEGMAASLPPSPRCPL